MTFVQSRLVPPVNYLPLWARFSFAFFISFSFIANGQTVVFGVTNGQNYRYFYIIGGFINAFLVIQLVHVLSKYLDINYKWTKKLINRFLIQFFVGIVAVLLLEALLVTLDSSLFSNSFLFILYMKLAVPTFTILVLFVNMLYFSWYLVVNNRRVTKLNTQMSVLLSRSIEDKRIETAPVEKKRYAQIIDAKLGIKLHRINIKDVMCFQRKSNIGYIYGKDQKTYIIGYRFHELEKMFDLSMFFQINRSQMVSIEAIQFVKRVNQKHYIELKPGADPAISLLVSRNRYSDFKKWYEVCKIEET